MHALHDVALPDDLEPFVPAVIEIPRGSKLKYEIDKATGMLVLDRVLYSYKLLEGKESVVDRPYDRATALGVMRAARAAYRDPR